MTRHLDELLIDHAHCEKKAAGVAMNLIFTYVDDVEICRVLSEIVQEELDHFRLVLDAAGATRHRLPPAAAEPLRRAAVARWCRRRSRCARWIGC